MNFVRVQLPVVSLSATAGYPLASFQDESQRVCLTSLGRVISHCLEVSPTGTSYQTPRTNDVAVHGKEQVIEFTAPNEEGAYPYFCSFPVHDLLIRGTLYVTNDIEQFLVKNPKPVIKTTECTLRMLQDDVARVGENRNFFQGQQLFVKLACAQCQKMTGVHSIRAALHNHVNAGHSHGPSLTVGPDLANVVKKHKGDAKVLLREILEPSLNVEAKY